VSCNTVILLSDALLSFRNGAQSLALQPVLSLRTLEAPRAALNCSSTFFLPVQQHHTTGATAQRLNLPSEEDFWSRGISACAICDGAAPIFKEEVLGVIGGGDSALEEAVYLGKYSPMVHLFVRGSAMRASKTLQVRVCECVLACYVCKVVHTVKHIAVSVCALLLDRQRHC
jgi:hypothetical protein